eukprot:GFUD01007154.1.p1 GENE.GFUD01007154.1~~GFUD01007154.1.p1  ORF type:complete len:221 (+),score=32.58 GFUD01007154.1:73-735(+)
MDYEGGLNPSLLAIRTSEESAKILKATICLLKCFLFIDFCYLVTGIIMIVMALSSHVSDKDQILYGGFFGLFAAMSAMCNCLARHGVRVWRRELLIPWLLFYPWVLGFLVINLVHTLCTTNFHLEIHQIVLFIVIFTVFSCWRQMNRQFMLMAFARPGQIDVQAAVRDYLSTSTGNDLPPKYEEVEDLPPQYDEATMGPEYTGYQDEGAHNDGYARAPLH